MPLPISNYGLRLLRDEAALRRSVTLPALIWESANLGEVGVMPTLSGFGGTRPEGGEAMVYELAKDTTKVNPFAMGITVGRTGNNDVVIPDPSISRFHAYLQQDAKSMEWRVVDAESRNGTWLGGQRLTPNAPLAVTDGARLRFGSIEVRFLTPESLLAYVRERLEA